MPLLEYLRELRELQAAQAEAIADADTDRLEALHGLREAVQSGLDVCEAPRMTAGDRMEAKALAQLLADQQAKLEAAAAALRERLGAELATLGRGRVAVSGYRPAPRTNARYLDSAG